MTPAPDVDIDEVWAVLRGDADGHLRAFFWLYAPGGFCYWDDRAVRGVPLTDADKVYLEGLLKGAPVCTGPPLGSPVEPNDRWTRPGGDDSDTAWADAALVLGVPAVVLGGAFLLSWVLS